MKPAPGDESKADPDDDVENGDAETDEADRPAKPGQISSEPPPWAIILIAATFFGGPLLLSLAPDSWNLSSTIGIVSIFAAPMIVMLLAMLAVIPLVFFLRKPQSAATSKG